MPETVALTDKQNAEAGLVDLRKVIDERVDAYKSLNYRGEGGRELSLVITKLQEARLWAGEALKEMGHFDK